MTSIQWSIHHWKRLGVAGRQWRGEGQKTGASISLASFSVSDGCLEFDQWNGSWPSRVLLKTIEVRRMLPECDGWDSGKKNREAPRRLRGSCSVQEARGISCCRSHNRCWRHRSRFRPKQSRNSRDPRCRSTSGIPSLHSQGFHWRNNNHLIRRRRHHN